MNGFVRLLESIIASVILLSSLSFFVSFPQLETNWNDVILQDIGKDALAVAELTEDLKGAVRYNNLVLAENIFLSVLPKNVGFSMEVSGIPNPVIFIGCNCTQTEINDLENRLDPLDFSYKGRNISIRVENVQITDIRPETNILFIFGYKDLGLLKNSINDFLEGGGTIFMFADLTQDVVNDGVINSTFNLSWEGTAMLGSGTFLDSSNPDRVSFRIKKYYDNISDDGSLAFYNFHTLLASYPVNRIRTDTKTVIIDDQGLSIVKTNSGVEKGSGRTVWFAKYDGNDNDELLKSMIMWASGERFNLDMQPKTFGKKNVKMKTFIYDRDPYIFSLTLWNIFR